MKGKLNKTLRVRLTEQESIDRYNKLLSIMDRPITTMGVSESLNITMELTQYLLGKLTVRSNNGKVLVTRYKENNASPRNNKIPYLYVKHVDSITADDIGYYNRAEAKAEKELKAQQDAIKAAEQAEIPLKPGTPRVFTTNDNPWYREKKPTGKTHVSGSSLNLINYITTKSQLENKGKQCAKFVLIARQYWTTSNNRSVI